MLFYFQTISYKLLKHVQFSCSGVSDSVRPHESQHARPPCPSPTPGIHRNSCPSSQWCHPAISSSAVPFSSCPQSLPASGSFPMSLLSKWGGQSTGVSASASVLPINTQDWSPLEWTGWYIKMHTNWLAYVNTTVLTVFYGLYLKKLPSMDGCLPSLFAYFKTMAVKNICILLISFY